MILPIHKLLSEADLDVIRHILEQAPFEPGRATASGAAARVKNNLQLVPPAEPAIDAGRVVLAAIRGHRTFQSATYIAGMTAPCFSLYESGMGYGEHIDSAVMGTPPSLRADISVTISLVDGSTYQGGDLIIDVAGVSKRWKGGAGDAVIYPSDTLHRVEPVTAGARLVTIFWIQSLVRDSGRRRILFDISSVIERFEQHHRDDPYVDTLRRTHMNLLRMWTDIPAAV